MLYQKLLLGNEPYYLSVSDSFFFETHRHPEIELAFCIQGDFYIESEGREFRLYPGMLAVISPMAAHSIPRRGSADCMKLTAELGPTLIGDTFDIFMGMKAGCTVMDLNQSGHEALRSLLMETAKQQEGSDKFRTLIIKGNLYKIAAALLAELTGIEGGSSAKPKQDIGKIEKALALIYNRYFDPLDIGWVSAECGYSKSNFCKIFKAITGETFHSVLNRHRVEIACMHLRHSSAPIEEISHRVGFADSKSFCRVFGRQMGVSPGEYRKGI